MPRFFRPVSVLAAFALLASAVSAFSAELPPLERERLAPSLAAAWDSDADVFDVIVQLNAPPEAFLPLPPRGVEFPRARLDVVKETSTQALGEIQEHLTPGDIVTGHVYRLRPAFSATVSRAGLAQLAAHPAVRLVEEDLILRVHTAEGVPLMNGDVAHTMGFTGAGYSVAIIDTGVDYNHPALGGGPIPNGKVVHGKDTANFDDDPMDCTRNCQTHGTQVASIAAGWEVSGFNGGVAPDAQILAYRTQRDSDCENTPCDESSGVVTSAVISAIEDATMLRDTYNVAAINMSIGGGLFVGPCDTRSSTYAHAVDDATEAGISVVVSSGNEHSKEKLGSPACLANAVSVGAVYDAHFISVNWGDCLDSGIEPGDVNCYSNSNSYLDMLAPSFSARVARPLSSSSETGFAGTSAAAPYAAGAFAVLYEAIPGITPNQARLLLEITGRPVTDPDNGITTPLIDLEAAITSTDVGYGDETNVPIPNGSGAALSHAVISEDGFVEGLTVQVKITHSDPTELAVTLISPDGTRVMLHDHTDGNSEPGSIDASFGANGIYTTYPDLSEAAEDLDAFLNLQAPGTWTLEVVDDDPQSRNGVDPQILGWALRIDTKTAPEPPSASSFFIPVGAHATGSNDTFWVSDARIFNPSFSDPATINLYLVPSDEDGTEVFQQTNVTVQPKTVLDLPDLLGERFGVEEGTGNLVFATDANLVATSRTYNTGGAVGTYGQFIGKARAADAIGVGDPAKVLLQLASNAAFRTNIGFSEATGTSATVRVTLFDGETGNPLGSPATYVVLPFSNAQISRIFNELGAGNSDNAYATVEVVGGSGKVVSYASVVDELTGDAIYIPGSSPTQAASFVIPIVAKLAGAAGTNWVTDVRVYNSGQTAASLLLQFRPQPDSGGVMLESTLQLSPGQVLAADDVLGSLFGQESGSGSLRLVPQGAASLIASSRTYNQTDGGTYGQFIGAVTSGFSGSDMATLIHLDKNQSFRSNVGICEVGGGTVEVRFVLKDSDGNTIQGAVGTETLGPYEVRQISDIYGYLGASRDENNRVDFFLDGGGGAFVAYGSVVDNLSGDAIYIPAVAY